MTLNKIVAVLAIPITIVQTTVCGEASKSYNLDPDHIEFCAMNVRATKYHKSEKGADQETRNGLSSSGIHLREGSPNKIGTIATRRSQIPVGSLVLITTKKGEVIPYLSVDVGGDVNSGKAARELAKKAGLGKEYASRPVIDIYSARTITEDWISVLVIKDHSLSGLKSTELIKRLKERMSVNFWPPKETILQAQALKDTHQQKVLLVSSR